MSKGILFGIIILLLAVLAGGGYWWMSSKTDEATMAPPMTQNTPVMSASPSSMTPEASSSTTEAMMTKDGVKEFTVEGSNFKFNPATLTVKKGDKVKITFKNTGGTHDWVLDGYNNVAGKVIQGGEEEVIEFTADKAGSFEYYCSVGNHRQMGMKGTLTVQ